MIALLQLILLIFICWILVGRESKDGLLKQFSRKRDRIVLDSCALIDGRIVEIVDSGFLQAELIVPQFIINELQMLADGHDSHKRERARFGLDIAHQLQDSPALVVTVDPTLFADIPATDDKLVALAEKLKARLYTTDYNLAKVAAIKAVQTLNVNDLAGRLRPIALPGEVITIKIVQKGSGREQGVGYLEDGTMIVVDNAARFVGKTVPVTVTRMHQTIAGKMVFGQVRLPESAAKKVAKSEAALAKSSAVPAPRTATPQSKLHGRLARARSQA